MHKKKITIAETSIKEAPEFASLCDQLSKSFSINGKAATTLNNYTRYLSHLDLHYNKSPECLTAAQINPVGYFQRDKQLSFSLPEFTYDSI